MSGVGISGLLANLPGTVTPYPVLDQSSAGALVLGGLRTANLVADMTGIGPQFRSEGMLVYVKKTKCIYALESDLTTWTIIANVGLGLQATWWIDPVNGNDANDGITQATAIKTATEFRNRCFPFGAQLVIKQAVTITVVAASALTITDFYVNFGSDSNANQQVNIVAQVSSTANITLSAVQQIAASTKTRGSLTTLAGAFVAGELIRVTSGAALGALAYSMGLNGGATSTFVSNFGIDPSNKDVWPSVGDTVVVDIPLVTVSRFEVLCTNLVKVNIQFFKITTAEVTGFVSTRAFSGGGGNVTYTGCQQLSASGVWSAPSGATLFACRTVSAARIALVGNEWLIINHAIQGVLNIDQPSAISYGLFLNGGNLVIGADADDNHPGDGGCAALYAFGISATNDRGAIEAENGPGVLLSAAIVVAYSGRLINDSFRSEMWGASGGYALGFDVFAGGGIYFSNNPTLNALSSYMGIAATNALRVGGLVFPTYSATPIAIKNSNCGVYILQVNGLETDNVAYLTAQTAAIGAQVLLSATGARKGMYRFKGYLAPTVAGAAGNLTLNAIYTDDSGTTQTLPVCSIDNTVLAGKGGSLQIECNGTSAISWSVTGYSAGLTYTVRVGAELDSFGSL